MQQRFLLQFLLLPQHVSGTTKPIIRSSGVLYSGCCLWYFVLWFSSCWSGVELRVMCPVCIADLIACSTCFGHHYAHHQELKSIIQWLLPVVFGAVVFKFLVWCGTESYVSGLQDAKPLLHLVGILFPHINDDARSKSHQIYFSIFCFILSFSFSTYR